MSDTNNQEIDMEFSDENIVTMSMNVDGDITVFNDSKEYTYLSDKFFDQSPVKSILKKFGYDGSFIITERNAFLIQKKVATTFNLRMIDES